MKSRAVTCALGLLAILGALACGGGDGSDTPQKPTAQAPGAPSAVTGVPGDGHALVTWTAPTNDGGSAIQDYVVRAMQDGSIAKTQRSATPSVTVSGLTNGVRYTFTVAATNSVGEGPVSVASAAVVPRVIPGAPRNVVATPGDKQTTVTWEEPADTGMPITGYIVTVREGETVVVTQQASGRTATITGLINGRSYQVTVTANNSVVGGPSSGPVAVTPVSVPGAPTLTARFNTERVYLSWTVADDGGRPVLGYTVTVRDGDTVLRTIETTDTQLEVSELTNGTTYHFIVVARNDLGVGVASEPTPVKPCAAAGRPRSPVADEGDGQVTLRWLPPTDQGGCPVERYRVTTLTAEGEFLEWSTPDLSFLVTGLRNGTTYSYSVSALSQGGEGSSVSIQATPYTRPSVPVALSAVPGDGLVSLSWDAPFDGGSLINHYEVISEPGGQRRTFQWAPTGGSYDITGLTNGTLYTFSVRASNNAGYGDAATATATPTAP
ncbi:fibronectin type III domain-containing protein [Pyxidicoccus sp. MSG2]|uniref:fibronectin type III domain-containing protein n=1 Tax=Pyxidicoccus sp. MSG2 TaxID=2996790 RepID=UPI0022713AF8|nr:fibronectin type III domain-containing protein [Pyxidicoccus sp. MSG2]MCY1021802.1 fibronectin type III domain-containing protein [Pyxidicoccus sp. MSG2]